MVGELNRFFADSGVPLRLDIFSRRWFYPHFDDEIKYGSLLYFHLRDKGVHIWEGRPVFPLHRAHGCGRGVHRRRRSRKRARDAGGRVSCRASRW